MNEDGIIVAIVGAVSELGRELQDVLDTRGVVVAEWRLYDTTNQAEDGDTSALPADLLPLDDVELEGVDVLFICGPADSAREWSERGREVGALVVDVSQGLGDSGATLIVPEVNADAVADAADRGVFACPVPGATALAVTLKPLDEAATLRRVVVTALEPASYRGTAGVDELATQTRQLLTGESVEPVVFPHRVAFNLIPRVGDDMPGGRVRGEWDIETQTRAVLGLPDLPLTVTSIHVPTFYGQGYAVSVETERPLDATAASDVLRGAPGVLLVEEGSGPTLADVVGSDATQVGRLRDDPTVPYGLALWVAIDGLRKGAAVNAVQIAERALRERG
ncbi:MAG: Asd/ArgC dimerization domain-containing protein [Deltaproteobacteria bacterium]|nr:Asd/ArgC dimerization domain-containing protein [Deltaproteobacteria bacterium]